MFRVFESLDELVQILEEAHGVLLLADCMVPRQRVPELLDELGDAFPAELDDAQDVPSQRDEIINDAGARAGNIISSADEEAHRTVDEAEARVNHTVESANTHTIGTVAAAEDDTRRLCEDAQHEYDSIVDRVPVEPDRLIHVGSESYEYSAAEGHREQVRLAAESAVVHEASDKANHLLSDAHADFSRLREECDRYVDFKFVKFEWTLQETLRNVGHNHSVLHSGAGAVGGGADAQNVPSFFPDGQERRRYERQDIFGVDRDLS